MTIELDTVELNPEVMTAVNAHAHSSAFAFYATPAPRSVAEVLLDDASARFAHYATAPEELAVAVFGQVADYRVIAATAAHETAAV